MNQFMLTIMKDEKQSGNCWEHYSFLWTRHSDLIPDIVMDNSIWYIIYPYGWMQITMEYEDGPRPRSIGSRDGRRLGRLMEECLLPDPRPRRGRLNRMSPGHEEWLFHG